MSLLSIILLTIFIINILLAFLLIFFERKEPAATWAWLMVLLIIPGLGFVLYLFLGQNLSREKMFNIKTEEDIEYNKSLMQFRNLIKDTTNIEGTVTNEYSDLIHMNYINSQSVFTNNNHIEIFTEGILKFEDLIEEIKGAKEFIHMTYYIIKPDTLGTEIRDVLIEKAKEGVEIKLLYDAMGGREIKKGFFDELTKAGGEVASFFPSILPKINVRVNFRNHRKIAVIDGKVGYVGGFNIGDEYLGKSKKFGYWRDTHIKISGDAVNDLEQRFLLDWCYTSKSEFCLFSPYKHKEATKGNSGVQIVSSGPDSKEQQIRNAYLKMISKAKESIYIQTPYFVPDESIMEALRVAALCGTDVRIMIPNKPDHPFVYWATYSYIGELLPAGVKFYKYEKGFLHSKTIVVDNKISSVGTANMDIRSFKLNFEVNAVIYDPEVSEELGSIFERDILEAIEITKDIYDGRSLKIRVKESISRLLSPVL